MRSRAITLVLLAILPFLALTLFSYFDIRNQDAQDVQKSELIAAKYLATILETIFNDTNQLLMHVSRLPEIQRRDRNACNLLFARIMKQSPYYSDLMATDPDGTIFASSPEAKEPVNLSDRFYFRKAVETREFVIAEPVLGRITKKHNFITTYPILDVAGRPQGVISAGIDLEWLVSLLNKSNFPPTSAILLLDSSRKILFRYPDPLKYIGQTFPLDFIKHMAPSDEGVAEGIGISGAPRLFAFARLSLSWPEMWVTIAIPKNWAMGPSNQVLWRNLFWLGLVTLLAMAAAWYGGDFFVVQPVKKLRLLTDRLAAGDLTVRSGSTYSEGELGLLGHSFDQMADSLQGRESELQKSKERLRFLANQLLVSQEQERKRLASELHEELGHSLLTMQLSLRDIAQKLLPEQVHIQKLLQDQIKHIRHVLEEVRRLYYDLTPGDLEDLGLTNALENLIEDFGRRQPDINFQVDLPNLAGKLNLPAQTAIYRFMQEALTNIGKHAEPLHVNISACQMDGHLHLSVDDDGKGFDLSEVERNPKWGLGLAAMRERLHVVGGDLEIWSRKGQGTRLALFIPCLEKAECLRSRYLSQS